MTCFAQDKNLNRRPPAVAAASCAVMVVAFVLSAAISMFVVVSTVVSSLDSCCSSEPRRSALSMMDPHSLDSATSNATVVVFPSNVTLAVNLQGRLLAACVCVYGMSSGRNASTVSIKSSFAPYCDAAGFVTDGMNDMERRMADVRMPTFLQHGSHDVDGALVGTTADGIIVAFRGTLPVPSKANRGHNVQSLLDWIQDFTAIPVRPRQRYIHGKVHAGLYSSVLSLWADAKSTAPWWMPSSIVWDTILEAGGFKKHKERAAADLQSASYVKKEIIRRLSYLQNGTVRYPPKIYVTGHSKAGAMASIAALFILHEITSPRHTIDSPEVYTFASIKPGDAVFRRYYDDQITQVSYENYLDPVPFFPPSNVEWNMIHDDLTSITRNQTTTPCSRKRAKTMIETLRLFKNGKFESVGRRMLIGKNFSVVKPYDRATDYSAGMKHDHQEESETRSTSILFRRWIHKRTNHGSTSIKTAHYSSISMSSFVLDQSRIRDIVAELVMGNSSLLSHHKPSCRLYGYMHGVCETFCIHHLSKKPNKQTDKPKG